jgi:enamine deaminase RidA (YjgF/YER057c/UK114 family)
MSVYERLKKLEIQLPEVSPPVAAFVPAVRTGNLLFVSGHIAKTDGKPWAGQLGAAVTTEQGKEAARGIAIEILGTLQAATGDLNKIRRIVKLRRKRRFGIVWRHFSVARSPRTKRIWGGANPVWLLR